MSIKKLESAYYDEIQKINNRCNELEKENEQDLQKIQELNADYTAAIGEMDDEKADKLYEDIFQLKKVIGNRNNKLSILKSGNPETNLALRNAANNLLEGYFKEKEKNKELALAKAKEAAELREKYLDKVAEIVPLNDIDRTIRDGINRIFKTVDKGLIEKYNLHPKLGLSEIGNIVSIHSCELNHDEFIRHYNGTRGIK